MLAVRKILADRTKGAVNNGIILETVIDFWLTFNTEDPAAPIPTPPKLQKQVPKKTECNDKLFVMTKTSLKQLVSMVESHRSGCCARMDITKIQSNGHVAVCEMKCDHKSKHRITWNSSPKLPNGSFLVNDRILHGMICSGMLPVHYERLCGGSGIGIIGTGRRSNFFTTYKDAIKSEYETSIELALLQEVAYECVSHSTIEADGINIISDARHGGKKMQKTVVQ
jgi:hypothetical protein